MALYEENNTAGNGYRVQALEELEKLIEARSAASTAARRAYFTADTSSKASYERDTARYREAYLRMLGWPLAPEAQAPAEGAVEETFVAEDDLGRIYRLRIPVMEGLRTYGLLFVPRGKGPFPLAICQHGGAGTPERVAGFFGSANYNDMVLRVRQRGILCFAPQLYLWRAEEYGPEVPRAKMEGKLKMLGGSFAALEVLMITRAIDALIQRPEVDGARVGMIGLSYGGLYTMLTAAADPRIRVACSSCAFHNQLDHFSDDWTWFDSANRFSFVEICKLICPRALYLETADEDPLFPSTSGAPLAGEVAETYRKLALGERFVYSSFHGEHELSKTPEIIDFLEENL